MKHLSKIKTLTSAFSSSWNRLCFSIAIKNFKKAKIVYGNAIWHAHLSDWQPQASIGSADSIDTERGTHKFLTRKKPCRSSPMEDMAEKNPRFEIGKYEAEFMLKEGNKY